MSGWAAAAMAVVQGGLSLVGGNEQRNAAKDANAQRKKQAKDAFKRQKKEYKIGWYQQQVQYAWDQAKIEAYRYQDRQEKALYEQQMGWLTQGAMVNLMLNNEALHDKYVTQEELRAEQEKLKFSAQMDSDLAATDTAMEVSKLESELTKNRAAQAQMETSQRVAAYVNSVQQRALEASRVVQEMNSNSQKLQAELILDEASETIQRDIEMIAAIEQSSGRRAALAARQGNSSSAVRASANKLQELGRSYALLQVNKQERGAKTAALNRSFGAASIRLSELGNQMANAVDQIQYSKDAQDITDKGFDLQQMGLVAKASGTASQFKIKTDSAMDQFNKLTLPSFGLAQAQGKRELDALKQQTQDTLNTAAIPYIDAITFDPLQPIKGLKPEFYEPTKQYVPSMLSIGANAVGAAVQGAMSMSYTDSKGKLQFH